MNNRPIKTHVDFKVETLSKLSDLINEGNCRVNIITSFGTIEGTIASYEPLKGSNHENLKSLMDDVIVEEYSVYLENNESNENVPYNFVVLDNVVLNPFSSHNIIEYEQLVVYVDQMVAFNFSKDRTK